MGHDVPDDPHHPHADHRRADPPAEHRAHAPAQVAAYAITCSDTRTEKTDQGGALIAQALERAGHTVVGQARVADDGAALLRALDAAIDLGARAVIVTGGTGLSRRDVSADTLTPRFEKTLPGFGELFRMLSFQEVGAAAMLSRAVAGTVRGALVFVVPGSPGAVKLALEELILPELGHAVRELSR